MDIATFRTTQEPFKELYRKAAFLTLKAKGEGDEACLGQHLGDGTVGGADLAASRVQHEDRRHLHRNCGRQVEIAGDLAVIDRELLDLGRGRRGGRATTAARRQTKAY
jgi:hypothetical protein